MRYFTTLPVNTPLEKNVGKEESPRLNPMGFLFVEKANRKTAVFR